MSTTSSRREILARIASVARRHLEIDVPLDESQRLVEDLGLDSLKLLTLAAEVENEFRLRIAPADEATIDTVGELVDLLERELAAVDRGGEDDGRVADRSA